MNYCKQLFVLLFLFVISCKKENPQQETNNLFKFKEYIYYTTSGVVSVTEPIQIGLGKDVEKWATETTISDKIITISPSVKGKLQATNSRTLVLKPEENLNPNTEYSVTVHLSKIYPNVPSEFKNYTFKFKTIEPNFTVNTGNLQSYSKEWQYLEGIVRSADILSLNKAIQLISATQNGKKLAVKWQETTSPSTYHEFKIDSIHRFKDDSEIEIKWSG
ncbi:MAG TPA: hypothetical protein ENK46_09065, partial [Flavobacteriia bacterium]|nr:hypothetical protein [Flavobacteriia bacterium]